MDIFLKILFLVTLLASIRSEIINCKPCKCDNVTNTISCVGEGPKNMNWGDVHKSAMVIDLKKINNFEFNHIPGNWRPFISTLSINESTLYDLDLSGFTKIEILNIDKSKILNEKSIVIPASVKHLVIKNSGLNYFKIPYEHNVEVVDLSGNNINEIPITKNVAELILNRNKLTQVKFSSNEEAKNLHIIDLSSNLITDLPENVFKNVISQGNPKRITINLAKNEMKTVHARAFAGIQIEKIRLDHNKLQSIDQKLLDWDRVDYIDLQTNPWICDCSAQWMLDTLLPALYIKPRPMTLFNLRCCKPSKFKQIPFAYWFNRTAGAFCGAESAPMIGGVLTGANEEIFWTAGMIATILLCFLIVFLLISIIFVCWYSRKKPLKPLTKLLIKKNHSIVQPLKKPSAEASHLCDFKVEIESITVTKESSKNSRKKKVGFIGIRGNSNNLKPSCITEGRRT